ncbi:MAG: beta-ketoacyl synthase N-terminal-like domain-containing protein [Isosphaeraceae bacterium]
MKSSPGRLAPSVLSVGLCTPLGLSTRVCQVEIEAGATRFQETAVLDDEGVPVRASVLNRIRHGLRRIHRVKALATCAIRECVQPLDPGRRWKLPLFLGLPAPRSGGSLATGRLTSRLRRAVGPHIKLELNKSQLFPDGRAAFFRALSSAVEMLEGGSAPLVLVGAVDSYCDMTSLVYLSSLGRHLSPSNCDGVIPGEGAGFVLLGRDESLTAPGPRMRVLACCVDMEARHFLQEEPNLGDGLTRVFRALRQHPLTGGQRVDRLLSCQTGETFWAREFAMASLRNGALMPEPLRGDLVAETLGDVGAASGAIQVGVAQAWLRMRAGQQPAPQVLIYACSDAGLVGGCVVAGE